MHVRGSRLQCIVSLPVTLTLQPPLRHIFSLHSCKVHVSSFRPSRFLRNSLLETKAQRTKLSQTLSSLLLLPLSLSPLTNTRNITLAHHAILVPLLRPIRSTSSTPSSSSLRSTSPTSTALPLPAIHHVSSRSVPPDLYPHHPQSPTSNLHAPHPNNTHFSLPALHHCRRRTRRFLPQTPCLS